MNQAFSVGTQIKLHGQTFDCAQLVLFGPAYISILRACSWKLECDPVSFPASSTVISQSCLLL